MNFVRNMNSLHGTKCIMQFKNSCEYDKQDAEL